MSGPKFFETRIGQRFFEGTMPQLVLELARLNTNLERLIEQRGAETTEKPKGDGEGEG